MFEETATYKRQQRRRAIIAWGIGGLSVVFLALAAIFGSDRRTGDVEPANPSGFTMSSAEYDSLEPGMDREEFAERIQGLGLPEDHVATEYLRLFPPPATDVSCSFWAISDRFEEIARVCFANSDGHLVDKLEHRLEEGEFGVTA